jgi:hypothetical protein
MQYCVIEKIINMETESKQYILGLFIAALVFFGIGELIQANKKQNQQLIDQRISEYNKTHLESETNLVNNAKP